MLVKGGEEGKVAMTQHIVRMIRWNVGIAMEAVPRFDPIVVGERVVAEPHRHLVKKKKEHQIEDQTVRVDPLGLIAKDVIGERIVMEPADEEVAMLRQPERVVVVQKKRTKL